MKISSAEEYALRAMSFLAQQQGSDRAYSLTEIAESEELPLPFLEQLFRELKQNQLVTSKRGAKGGYRLAKKATNTTVLEVMEAIRGEIIVQDCESGRCGRDSQHCKLSPLWKQLELRIKDTLQSTTLADLAS